MRPISIPIVVEHIGYTEYEHHEICAVSMVDADGKRMTYYTDKEFAELFIKQGNLIADIKKVIEKYDSTQEH